ncbi:DUF1643 domain-containing protein [Bacillus subtilis]|uniref:DUF1643 domain-containing protein n=1 Tax=Bacillus subtilis TaxID=1423 RepID=UPI002E1F3F97|nr:DUF1643 domain-containing protein [Bacillus subtilis]
MPVYKYKPEFVSKVIECKTERLTDSIEARYCLSIKLNNTLDSSYVFIMLNPSIAGRDVSDLTINKLCKFSHSLNEVGTIHIANLYPFYETNSMLLSSLIKNLQNENKNLFDEVMATNRQVLSSLVKDSKKVVLAWGDCPDLFDRQFHIKQCHDFKLFLKEASQNQVYVIKTHFERLLTVKNSPRHPSRPMLKGLVPYKESS